MRKKTIAQADNTKKYYLNKLINSSSILLECRDTKILLILLESLNKSNHLNIHFLTIKSEQLIK